GEQAAKKDGSFSTKKGELTIQANKTSVQLTAWNEIRVTAQYTENGKAVPVDISFSVPDDSKTYKITQNSSECGSIRLLIQLAGTTGGQCSLDGKATFDYQPKSLGTHTISVAAKGVTRSVDLQVAPYVKVDPAISDIVNSDCQPDCSAKPVLINMAEKSIGSFKFSQADESITFNAYDFKYESDIQEKGVLKIIEASEGYQLRVTPKTNTYTLAPGVHTVKITEIKVIGRSSGSYRYVTGLPVTFTFEIKENISYGVQTIVPSRSGGLTIYSGYVNVGYLIYNNTASPVTIKKIKARITTSDSTPRTFDIETPSNQQNVVIGAYTADQAGKLSFDNPYDTITGPLKIETISVETDSTIPVTGDKEIIKYY
ncbi:MAG: hypothetical protein Q8Q89_04435, partial [bacterium]|nr:hypothetical protein [bacterium]